MYTQAQKQILVARFLSTIILEMQYRKGKYLCPIGIERVYLTFDIVETTPFQFQGDRDIMICLNHIIVTGLYCIFVLNMWIIELNNKCYEYKSLYVKKMCFIVERKF